MTNQTERRYTSDEDAYERFVGQITPQEFVEPFDGEIEEAISSLISEDQWSFDEPPPSWLEDALSRYISEKLESKMITKITLAHKMTGDGQYLTDHHNRDEEHLFPVAPSRDDSELIKAIAEEIVETIDITTERAIVPATVLVASLSEEDKYPSILDDDPDEDGVVQIWILLTWEEDNAD